MGSKQVMFSALSLILLSQQSVFAGKAQRRIAGNEGSSRSLRAGAGR